MSNLHRELAPISQAAWAEIFEEASRTFKRRVAGRRLVDVPEAAGYGFSALGTGHVHDVTSPIDGVETRCRETLPVVELRALFTVTRQAVDDVDRGATNSDWDPVKRAAEQIALAEDRLVFRGDETTGIGGIIGSSSNPHLTMAAEPTSFPTAVASAMNQLREVGVEGPYNLALPAATYTKLAETTDHGYPVLKHLERLLDDGAIIWAPGLDTALLVSARGGDYALHLGQDLSVGYLGHDDASIRLYLQETLTFRVSTDEASVVIDA